MRKSISDLLKAEGKKQINKAAIRREINCTASSFIQQRRRKVVVIRIYPPDIRISQILYIETLTQNN